MANEPQAMPEMIRARTEMVHHFAERLAMLAREMREDETRACPATPA